MDPSDDLRLRPAAAGDESFLFALFRSVRSAVLAELSVPEQQREQLLRMQFDAQQHQYHARFPSADFDIVLFRGVPVGRFYARRGPEDFVLIDIALLPEHRNSGIGGRLVGGLIAEARGAGKAVQAHVQRDNPAWRLWQRLGFEEVGDDGAYLRIRAPAIR
jgi:ribosomal protein S18 acetylase RimI-like enzyme